MRHARRLLVIGSLLVALAPSLAWAQERARFGTVWRVQGAAVAVHADTGERRALAEGDVVYTRDRLETPAGAEVLLRTEDEGAVALRPQASARMDQYNPERGPGAQWHLRLLGGGLRIVTGWIARMNQPGYRVEMPTATVGVRGTDHEPYAMTLDLAMLLQQPAGSYDKVNRGETVLSGGGNTLAIPAGRVGYMPDAPRTRALGSVLLPALLEQVPGFYLAGRFDTELATLGTAPPAPAPTAPTSPTPATPTSTAPTGSATCDATAIATTWLQSLDNAVRERSAPAFVALFLPEARVSATVAGGNTLVFGRDELARSTLDALAQLSDFSTQRPTVSATADAGCQNLRVQSLVLERGVRQGQSYQIESVETFELQREGETWRAREATTRIR